MHVFISHSRQNASAALKLCDSLTDLGARTWLDVLELDAGSDWTSRVAEAIRVADAFIFLVGPPGETDQGQRFEWQQVTEREFYLDPHKPLIPLLIGDVELPGFLRARQALHVPTTGVDYADLAERVLSALKNPDESINQERLARGLEERQQAFDRITEYSLDLERSAASHAGVRGINR